MADAEHKYSELRQDIVSGEWVVIATGRARRPNEFISQAKPLKSSKKDCPFEALDENRTLTVTEDGKLFEGAADPEGEWFVEVIPNKFPAFSPRNYCPDIEPHGPYRRTDGVGFHEVVIMRPHDRSIAEMSVGEVGNIVRAYRQRFEALEREQCVEYISLIHNHGPLSGASIAHPHSQLIAIPVIPPDVMRSLAGSERYFLAKRECVHCVMIAHERSEQERIVFENDQFIAFAPFASHASFEIRIFPKRHSARFLAIAEDEIAPFAETLHASLAKLFHGLNDPSFNFFIHTSPTRAKGTDHYHWHVEILPKTGIWGGFEFGTGIEISTIRPEDAADFLRNVSLSSPA